MNTEASNSHFYSILMVLNNFLNQIKKGTIFFFFIGFSATYNLPGGCSLRNVNEKTFKNACTPEMLGIVLAPERYDFSG